MLSCLVTSEQPLSRTVPGRAYPERVAICIHGLLRDRTHTFGICQPLDIDALHDRPNLIAEISEKAQGIALFVRAEAIAETLAAAAR